MTEPVNVLKDKYLGQSCTILGGACCLDDDYERCPKTDVKIAINYHGAEFLGSVDYICFLDPAAYDECNGYDGETFSKYRYADYHRNNISLFSGHNGTGTFTLAFAIYLGFKTIYLCGIDCYRGEKDFYWDGKTARPSGADKTFQYHYNDWEKHVKELWVNQNIVFVNPILHGLNRYGLSST